MVEKYRSPDVFAVHVIMHKLFIRLHTFQKY